MAWALSFEGLLDAAATFPYFLDVFVFDNVPAAPRDVAVTGEWAYLCKYIRLTVLIMSLKQL